MCNYHRPVCVKCRIDMRPEKNDVYFKDLRLPTEENKYDVNVEVWPDAVRFGERG